MEYNDSIEIEEAKRLPSLSTAGQRKLPPLRVSVGGGSMSPNSVVKSFALAKREC